MKPTYNPEEARKLLESDELKHHWDNGTFIDLPCFNGERPVEVNWLNADKAFTRTFGHTAFDEFLDRKYVEYCIKYSR